MGYNKKVLRAIDRELKDRHRSKRYSKSLSATNSLFAPNYLFSKPSKRRIYNPNAKYFKHGGPQMHEGGNIPSHDHPHDPPESNYIQSLRQVQKTLKKPKTLESGRKLVMGEPGFKEQQEVARKNNAAMLTKLFPSIAKAEKFVNKHLGSPQEKARALTEKHTPSGEDPSDPARHIMAGKLSADAIKNKTGNIPYVSQGLGWLGSNVLGMGHELGTIFNDDRDWAVKLREAAEDMRNNLTGANLSFDPRSNKDITQEVINNAYDGVYPDGYGEKHPFKDNLKWEDPYELNKEQDGGYIELTDKEASEYRAGGYVLEEMSTGGPGDGIKKFLSRNNVQTSLGFGKLPFHGSNYTPQFGLNTIIGKPKKGFLDLGLTAGGDKNGFSGGLGATYYGPFMGGNRHFQAKVDADTYYDQGTLGFSTTMGGNFLGGNRNIGNRRGDALRSGSVIVEGGPFLQVGVHNDLNEEAPIYLNEQLVGTPIWETGKKIENTKWDFAPGAGINLQWKPKKFNNITLSAHARAAADLVDSLRSGAAKGHSGSTIYENEVNPDASPYTNSDQYQQVGEPIVALEAEKEKFKPEYKFDFGAKVSYDIDYNGGRSKSEKKIKQLKKSDPVPVTLPKPKKESKPIEVKSSARHPRWLQQGGSTEVELTDEEADKYRAEDYVLEEMHEGGSPHSHPHKDEDPTNPEYEYFDEAKQWVTDWHNSPMYSQMVLNSYNGNQANADYLNKLRKKNIETLPELDIKEHPYKGPSVLPDSEMTAAHSLNETGQIELFPSGKGTGPTLYVHEILHSSDRPRELYKLRHPSYKTDKKYKETTAEERINFGDYTIDNENNIVDYPDWMKYNDPRFPDEIEWRNRVMPVKDQRYINTHRGSNWKDNEHYKLDRFNENDDVYKYATDEDLTNLIATSYDINPDDPTFAEVFEFYKKDNREEKERWKKVDKDYYNNRPTRPRKKAWKEMAHNYISQPTEVRARLGEIRFFAQKEGIYDPFTEQITPEIFQNYINKERDDFMPMGPIKDLRRDFTDEEIIEMLNTISKNEETSNVLDDQYAQLGGPIEAELSDEEVEQYKADRYVLEKLHNGGEGPGHPHDPLPAEYLKSQGFADATNQDLDSLLRGFNTDGYDSHWYQGGAENYGITTDQLRVFANENRPKGFVNAAAYTQAMNKLSNDAGGTNVSNIPFAQNQNAMVMKTSADDLPIKKSYVAPQTLQEQGYVNETGTNAINQDKSYSTGLAKRYGRGMYDYLIEEKHGGAIGLGDKVDKATMQRLKKQGYTFQEI